MLLLRACSRRVTASLTLKQRASCCLPTRCAVGNSRRQRSWRKGQRGSNGQPLSAPISVGGDPGMEISSLPSVRIDGNAFFKPNVYG